MLLDIISGAKETFFSQYADEPFVSKMTICVQKQINNVSANNTDGNKEEKDSKSEKGDVDKDNRMEGACVEVPDQHNLSKSSPQGDRKSQDCASEHHPLMETMVNSSNSEKDVESSETNKAPQKEKSGSDDSQEKHKKKKETDVSGSHKQEVMRGKTKSETSSKEKESKPSAAKRNGCNKTGLEEQADQSGSSEQPAENTDPDQGKGRPTMADIVAGRGPTTRGRAAVSFKAGKISYKDVQYCL